MTRMTTRIVAGASLAASRCVLAAARGATRRRRSPRSRASGPPASCASAPTPPIRRSRRRGRRVLRLRHRSRPRDRARARRQAGVHQRQLRRHLSGAAERQLRHRAVGGDDHAGAARGAAVLGSLHRRGPAAGRPRRTAGHQRRSPTWPASASACRSTRPRSSIMEKRAGVTLAKYNTDRSGAARSAERPHRRGGQRRAGAALHDQLSFPELTTVGDQFTDEKLGIVLAQRQRRSAARGQRGAVEDRGQRRVRAVYTTVVRRGAGRAAGAAAAGAPRLFDPGLVSRTWRSSCAACG